MIRHTLLAAAFSLGIQPAFAGGVGQQGIVGSTPVKVGPGGAAANNDPRITGAVQKSANGSDFASLANTVANMINALPTCTAGSTTAPVAAGLPFLCNGLVLIAQ